MTFFLRFRGRDADTDIASKRAQKREQPVKRVAGEVAAQQLGNVGLGQPDLPGSLGLGEASVFDEFRTSLQANTVRVESIPSRQFALRASASALRATADKTPIRLTS